jgi:hypothetical protein
MGRGPLERRDLGTTWEIYTDLDYKENWGGGGVPQGLHCLALPKKDRVDVLGVNK